MTAGTGQMPSSSAADVNPGSGGSSAGSASARAAAGSGEGPVTASGSRASATEAIDEVLVARLRGGETAAGELLVRRYYAPLMRYLQRLAGNDHVAEELHQQTWLSVLDHIEKFDAAASGVG